MGDNCRSMSKKKLSKKTGLPRHIKDMSKEQLEATIRKKRECNAKALAIVEQMLEQNIDDAWFLDQLKYIDLGHFQDIIEERAMCKLCGYPLCRENLKNIASQQYRISTKYNKVYDITERKNFCSNQCYKAGKFVKDQLLTSPLWLRDKEDIPTFKLLPLESQGIGAGEEVDLGQNECVKTELKKIKTDESFISITDYTQDSISKLSKRVGDIELNEKNQENKGGITNFNRNKEIQLVEKIESQEPKFTEKEFDTSLGRRETKVENLETCVTSGSLKELCHKADTQPISHEHHSDVKNILDTERKDGQTEPKKVRNMKKNENEKSEDVHNCENSDISSSIILLETCLYEWFTLESMCFLFGEEKVKDLVTDKGDCIKEYYKAVGKSSWDPALQERYNVLCQKLNIMEIQEQQLDKDERQLKPLPDYNMLKEEGLKMDLKIQAFYHGRLGYEIPVNMDLEEKDMNTPSCVLPLVDKHAQNALRRRIVLDNFKRVLPDLLRTFGLTSCDISSDVRCLIGSFRLSAHNITFNPAEWNLLGLIIIKMLTIKDTRLKVLLETDQGIKQQTMLLMAFQQDGGYLDRLMMWLTDIDNIMKKT